MENALHVARPAGGQADERRVELTASGRLVLILAIAGASIGAWAAYQHYGSATPARVAQPAPHEQLAQQPAGALQAAPAAPAGASVPPAAQLTQVLLKERRDHEIQIAAWRALNEVTRQQIAGLQSGLQALDGKIDAIQKTPPPVRLVHAGAADAVSSARALHSTLDATKTAADIDVASLPVETVSAQTLNVTGFGNGVVEIGNQKLMVGQLYQPGETIVAVDPVSRSIVTNRRIINVSN
jgi:hypothetical protein